MSQAEEASESALLTDTGAETEESGSGGGGDLGEAVTETI
jgi:hypothetical protein